MGQEIILESTGLGYWTCAKGGFDVYAEICKASDLKGVTYIARIVECPDWRSDKEVRHVEFESREMANTALESLVASYRRSMALA